MNIYELYPLDNPDEVVLETMAETPEEALDIMAANVGADERVVSLPLLTMAAGGRLLGVRGVERVTVQVKGGGDEW